MKNRAFLRQEERKNIGNHRAGQLTAQRKRRVSHCGEGTQRSSCSTQLQKPYPQSKSGSLCEKSHLPFDPLALESPKSLLRYQVLWREEPAMGVVPQLRGSGLASCTMKENLLFKSDLISELQQMKRKS